MFATYNVKEKESRVQEVFPGFWFVPNVELGFLFDMEKRRFIYFKEEDMKVIQLYRKKKELYFDLRGYEPNCEIVE